MALSPVIINITVLLSKIRLLLQQFSAMEQSQAYSLLFQGYDITQPNISCRSCKQQTRRLCTFTQCPQYSLHCQNQKCEKFKPHTTCRTVHIIGITNMLKQHFQMNKDFVMQLFGIQDALVRELTERREEMVRLMSLGNLEEKYARVVEEIFRKKNGEYLRGKESHGFFKRLVTLSKFKNNAQPYIERFAAASKKLVGEIMAIKESILTEYSTMARIVEEVSFKGINSAILKPNDLKFQEHLNFLYDSLGKPRGLQLLFRASDNQFDAAKFHEKCDDTDQTLTLIRTEYGKTIAGYNHLKWNTAYNGFLIDHEKKCFLLSLDLKQKMTLSNYKQAVANNQGYGPIFGAGNDIVIHNKCNQNNSSSANFPTSYNFGSLYTNSQASYTAFSGATNGKNFKVLEYEVFKVIK